MAHEPQSPQLTANQQALLQFLDRLATEPVTPEMLAQGNQLLDSAADECRELQEQIAHQRQQQQGGQP